MSRKSSRGGAARSRRRFLQQLGAASAAVPLAGLWPALAQAPAPASPPVTAPPAPTPTPPSPAPERDPLLEADAQSLLDIVKRRFGTRLDTAQQDAVRGDLEDNLRAASRLRKLDLRNADEPDIVFRAQAPEV